MKGQLFLIAGLIMIVVFTSLKTSLSVATLVENQRHLVAGLDSLEFSNIRSEMMRSMQISYNNTSNMTNNLINFNSFLISALSAKTVQFNSLIIAAYYTNLTANTNTVMNVTVDNSLGTDLQFLNLTFNGTSATSSLANLNTFNTSFTINIASSTNQSLTVFYNTTTTSQTETITIPLNISHGYYVTFFDLRYITNRGQQSDKFTYTSQLS